MLHLDMPSIADRNAHAVGIRTVSLFALES